VKFLADESCARPVIFALREAEHDVLAIAEVAKGAVDEVVMELPSFKLRALSESKRGPVAFILRLPGGQHRE
jgi:hypothetical protein